MSRELVFDYSKTAGFIREEEIVNMKKAVLGAKEVLTEKTGAGNDFLGWIDLPVDYDKDEFDRIKKAAEKIKGDSDVLLVIGIGGSYLGARAAIEFLSHSFYNVLPKGVRKTPEIYFVGNSISSKYIRDLQQVLEGKDFSINIISKSGTTTEPAIAFRVFKEMLVNKYGKDEASKRIYATTDKARGALKNLADQEGYEEFVVPDDVGGRYSVLTAVGLLPIAVSGADIDKLMEGAASGRKKALELPYEIVPVASKKEYEALVEAGDVDIWMDMSGDEDETGCRYRLTEPYLSTTVSVLRVRGASEKIERLVADDEHISVREIVSSVWPDMEFTVVGTAEECAQQVLAGEADAALLMTYTAQRLARDDLQNRLRVDIVPGAVLELSMGINANDSAHFYGSWEKTLAGVADGISAEIVQKYLEQTAIPMLAEYLFDYPIYLAVVSSTIILLVLMAALYIRSSRSKKRQEKISRELAAALERTEEATTAKQDFFSKMSHDIRTPLNVVLSMTQIAQKYKNDPEKLESALNNVTKEGNYLLMLINSILDVNQLEHDMVELVKQPFDPAACLRESADMLRSLAEKRGQQLTVQCECTDRVVMGDENRLKQILINIISNAIKYTDIGGHIALRLESLPEYRNADFEELTPAMLRDLIEKIIVHEGDKSSGHREQRIEIYYTFISAAESSQIIVKHKKKAA